MKPSTCCQQQTQFCCLDTRCAFPCTEDVPMMCTCLPGCLIYPKFGCCAKVKDVHDALPESKTKDGKGESFDLSDVPVGELRVCEGLCCIISSFLCKYPECLGAKAEGLCLCCQIEQSMCKKIDVENEAGICCICCDGGQYISKPSTCCAFAHTCFCLDQRCACPPTEKVPCVCTCLPGCTLCAAFEFKPACCPLLGDIVPACKEVGKAQVLPETVDESTMQQSTMQGGGVVNQVPVQGQMVYNVGGVAVVQN